MQEERKVNIIGAGLAGLSAALTLAKAGARCRLISLAPSERAQSVLAEGGTNAVLNTMGDDDTIEDHVADTLKGGCDIADQAAVRDLCERAPEVIRELEALGVPFNRNPDGSIAQRYFGGQKKRRTAFVGAFTGKMLMTALIDAVRRYEAEGLVERYAHHAFAELLLLPPHPSHSGTPSPQGEGNHVCAGVRVCDTFTQEVSDFEGPVILCSGGINGFFPGHTTGTVYNSGDVTATVFSQGVALSNLEMIQFHPTTIAVPGKRVLISEAARGEGGRLFVMQNSSQERYYFMEERYPELGNLMPRDVVTRESVKVMGDAAYGDQVYLDMTGIPEEIWTDRLSELREEILHYLEIEPKKEPVPVAPGIHYFMGGILTDKDHRTNIEGLFAAGECCSTYHGANRLGGNSTMGAMVGGRVAADSALRFIDRLSRCEIYPPRSDYAGHSAEPVVSAPWRTSRSADTSAHRTRREDGSECVKEYAAYMYTAGSFEVQLGNVLYAGMGVVRDAEGMQEALDAIKELEEETEGITEHQRRRLRLAKAMLMSALARKESRGAHTRSDFPDRSDHPYVTRVAYDVVNGLQCQILDVDA